MQMCPQYASNLADGNNSVQYKANIKRKKIIERKKCKEIIHMGSEKTNKNIKIFLLIKLEAL